ncbi:hypothetical protein FRC08_008207 [Ceratobasidium sp. 394]|nr:hypothetical protein FRC08_008207 [Ceratobasidium sp. 394]
MTATENKLGVKLAPAAATGGADDEDDHDESIVGGGTPEHNAIPAPTKKRSRINPAEAKIHQKKHVRGKQGGFKGLMNMPIEIFTEIAYLLAPGDLIALARSNKFFRELLFQRSAINMWRRAESNVPGLPPCPRDMCEPQYAALIFSKHCTLCGASATAKPDPDLHVRLCASCRDTELEELNRKKPDSPADLVGFVHTSKNIRPKKNKSALKGSVFCLKREAKEAIDERTRFYRTRDRAKWEQSRQAVVATRRKHAERLFRYLEDIEVSHEEELETIKANRRAT